MNFFQFAAANPLAALLMVLIAGCTLVGVANGLGKAFRKRA